MQLLSFTLNPRRVPRKHAMPLTRPWSASVSLPKESFKMTLCLSSWTRTPGDNPPSTLTNGESLSCPFSCRLISEQCDSRNGSNLSWSHSAPGFWTTHCEDTERSTWTHRLHSCGCGCVRAGEPVLFSKLERYYLRVRSHGRHSERLKSGHNLSRNVEYTLKSTLATYFLCSRGF